MMFLSAISTSGSSGVTLSLSASFMWAISPMFMASAGRRIGSQPTNLLRILGAAVILMAFVLPGHLIAHGTALPLPSGTQWFWLALSGLIGMVGGDSCFYEALVRLGPRRAVKMNMLAPVVALGLGWFWLGEKITPMALAGAIIVITAVLYATMAQTAPADPSRPAEPGSISLDGLAFGVGAAICMALGSVMARRAFQAAPSDVVVATVVRVLSAAIVLWGLTLVSGRAASVTSHLKDAAVRNRLLGGTLLGPIGGMLCYVGALQNAEAGLVSTLVATSPLVIIPLVAWRYRTKIRLDIILAATAAVAGVAMISSGR